MVTYLGSFPSECATDTDSGGGDGETGTDNYIVQTHLIQLLKYTAHHNTRRVATAQGKQGKQGIWFSIFPDRENTGNFAVTQGKFWRHRENIF